MLTYMHLQTAGGPKSIIDHVEEYGMLVVIGIAVLYYLYTRVKRGYESVAYEMKSRKAEDAIRRAREAQQARYWEETAEKREELERIERERRANKLEDMEAMTEGRTSKAKKTLKVALFPLLLTPDVCAKLQCPRPSTCHLR